MTLSAAGIAIGLAQQPAQQPGAATNTASRIDPTKSLSSNEVRFVEQALFDGRAEVEIGNMALRQSSNDQVKEFAQRLINDHTSADKKLEQIAKEYGVSEITAPSKTGPAYRSSQERTSMNKTGIDPKTNQPAPGPRAASDPLANMTGKDFDRAFAQQMIRDHQQTITDFEAARSTVMNADLKAFITETLPTLQEHLQHARELK
jgi:putative membrane protein